MKKVRFSLLSFIFFLVAALFLAEKVCFAAFDQMIPKRQRGKFFTPSLRLRGEWNDNISAKRGSDGHGPTQYKVKSMIYYAEPKIQIRLPFEQTYFGFDYQYSLAYFNHRPYDNEDTAHDISAVLKHNFSPRLTFDMKEDYTFQQAGAIKHHRVVIRTKGDYERNKVDTTLKYDITRSWYITGKYTNEFINFKKRSESLTFDYYENRVGMESGYILNKQTILLMGYDFKDRQYELRENADYDSHILYGGVNYRLAKYFSLDATSGVDFRTHESPKRSNKGFDFRVIPTIPSPGVPVNSAFVPVTQGTDGTEANPYISARLTTNYFRNTTIILGYQYMTQTTEQENFTDATTQAASLQVSYKILPKVTLDLTAGYSVDSYQGRAYRAVLMNASTYVGKVAVSENPQTRSFNFGAVVSYQVTPWLFYEAGYRRTDYDSDFNTATWDRNSLFTGINAIF